MSDESILNIQPGTVINGRYEVVRCLGAGSMGMVYACRHRELAGRLVAMKVLFPEVASDETAKIRFENEIFASYEVNHPNVVRAYEYFHDGDLIAFTMEYIGGGDLADKLGGTQPLPIPSIIRMLTQMASGVSAIHKAGIIHRDLKPENILLTPQGDIKITDFGIARTGVVRGLTQHGGVVGTIDYVSPEYLEKGEVDERSDIYSLGVLAYEMLANRPPFAGGSVIATMTMRIKEDPTPPNEIRIDTPDQLNRVVMKALSRDIEARYQTAEDLFFDLEDLASLPLETSKPEKSAARTAPEPFESSMPSEPLLPDEFLSQGSDVTEEWEIPSAPDTTDKTFTDTLGDYVAPEAKQELKSWSDQQGDYDWGEIPVEEEEEEDMTGDTSSPVVDSEHTLEIGYLLGSSVAFASGIFVGLIFLHLMN